MHRFQEPGPGQLLRGHRAPLRVALRPEPPLRDGGFILVRWERLLGSLTSHPLPSSSSSAPPPPPPPPPPPSRPPLAAQSDCCLIGAINVAVGAKRAPRQYRMHVGG